MIRLLVCWSICSCLMHITIAQQKSPAQSNNLELAAKWIALLNLHDSVGLEKLYDKDCQLLSPNWEGTKTGARGAKEVYSRYFSSTPDLDNRLTHLIATDSALVLEYVSSGTLSNPEKNTPAYMQGKKYSLLNCTRMDIRDGKILKTGRIF
jgi:SnoaL-like domain